MQLTRAGRWSLVALVVVVALIVAIWPRDADDPASAADGGRPTAA
ncbi:thioredoxin, partial [Rhodococcus rhodochrous]